MFEIIQMPCFTHPFLPSCTSFAYCQSYCGIYLVVHFFFPPFILQLLIEILLDGEAV